MPYYVIRFEVGGPHGTGVMTVSVDAHAGTFAVFLAQADVVEGPVRGEAFGPALSEEEAIDAARKGLLRALLSQRSKGRRMKPGDVKHVDLLRYPYWVYYYERRRGLLDIRVVDARSGERPGTKTKYAILSAFERASSST
jgi:hypothetical protein